MLAMSGRGRNGVKRHRKVPTDESIQGFSKFSIRRLAKLGGVKRMSGLVYEVCPGVSENGIDRPVVTLNRVISNLRQISELLRLISEVVYAPN